MQFSHTSGRQDPLVTVHGSPPSVSFRRNTKPSTLQHMSPRVRPSAGEGGEGSHLLFIAHNSMHASHRKKHESYPASRSCCTPKHSPHLNPPDSVLQLGVVPLRMLHPRHHPSCIVIDTVDSVRITSGKSPSATNLHRANNSEAVMDH
jgi:hypothetical protein